MTFGEKLQGLRQKSGMSQDALAEQLNVSRQAVSRWERDETMPETDKVVALADLFGVTTDYLLRQQAEEQTTAREHNTRGAEKRDWVDQLAYLVKTKGYLLGWLLIFWGVMDLLGLLSTLLMVNGFLFNLRVDTLLSGVVEGPVTGMVTGILWLPALYGVIKVVAGILVLRYGKRYADKVKEEEYR